ncbi:hypothetical protein BZA77DRAFT_87237 [Pyronema omphalodes]|nr:hypothetical protein BZA77DRAFT_87237 [Pyronema omphalodes]
MPAITRRDGLADIIKFPMPSGYGAPKIDDISLLYISLVSLLTSVLLIALFILYRNRKLPFIKLRSTPLTLTAVLLLHLQLVFDLLSHPLNGVLPCGFEYWVMSICLPCGIAAFQVNNWVLFSRAWGQQQLIATRKMQEEDRAVDVGLHASWIGRMKWKWGAMGSQKKMTMVTWILVGVQVVVAVVIYGASRRFHHGVGVMGEEVTGVGCRLGWEWLPSAIWQFVWTYGFGPYILFKIRHIQDTHYWRLQTTLAIMFSLPALPLWLTTWFMPKFYEVNYWWGPNLWFVPGLIAMETCILLFPIIEIWQFKYGKNKRNSESKEGVEKYSEEAMTTCMKSPEWQKLEEFAVMKDLSGENVLFLKAVQKWKSKHQLIASSANSPYLHPAFRTTSPFIGALNRALEDSIEEARPPTPVVRELYAEAESIFRRFISRESAEFPLNLDDAVYTQILDVFTGPEEALEHFGGDVFDQAEAEIYQLVLQNTWVRYVDMKAHNDHVGGCQCKWTFKWPL